MSAVTIGQALQAARARIGPVDARLLLRHALDCSAVWLEIHDGDPMPAAADVRFADWVARRAAGEPVAYLIGMREFFGRAFLVTPNVLIPRPETELLVEQALLACAPYSAPRILDLGTGSGCIALTLALECKEAVVTAIDFATEALQVAVANGRALGGTVRFVQGAWFDSLDGCQFDLIVSNPPYISAGDPHLNLGDLRFEPQTALVSDTSGLRDLEAIITAAPAHLTDGGRLLLEHGYDQADAVARLLRKNGFIALERHRDLAGIERVAVGTIDRVARAG